MSASQPSFDLGPAGDPQRAEVTFGVAELTAAVNDALRVGFPSGAWVRGEISGLVQRGPHTYFRLVEETDTGRASLDVSLFANTHARLRPLLRSSGLRLADGLRVRVHGTLDVFAPTGRLSLKMDGLDPRHTLGDLAMQRQETLRRLVAEGLFDANRRRPMPPAPLRLGVVTSASSAAWADFRHELERSGLGFDIALADVRVQGDTAVAMICRAIRTLSARRDLDVVVVIRGGGARTDLATFDDEAIARAICASALPVLTGLGHEVDRAVADEVAHSALKTPTAAAATLVERVRTHLARCEAAWQAIRSRAGSRVDAADTDVLTLAHGIRHHTVAALERSSERLATRSERLTTGVRRRLDVEEEQIAAAGRSVARRSPLALAVAERAVDDVAARVRLLDPVNVLARGWSITRDASGAVVRDPSSLAPGDVLHTQFAAGTVDSTVSGASSVPPAAPAPPPGPGRPPDDR